jgi:ubiquinone/menaquinone biosynthesis C-methylase UbiE
MSASDQKTVWSGGEAYEPYVGRWSRLVAKEFVSWLHALPSSRWVDVGCVTGVLARMIVEHAEPCEVHGRPL